MDWFKKNKFLSGFLIVVLLAAGGLAFLAFTAMGNYDTAYAEYQTKASELNELQTKQPFPEQTNVKKMQELAKAHQAAIDALHKDLIKAQLPVKQLSPDRFQDNLREAVRRVAARAAEHNVTVKPDLYLGFAAYQSVPPKQEAATPLGHMLEAIELAANMLIDNNITELSEIKRDPLPEEGAPASSQESTSKPQKGEKEKDKDKDSGLVKRHSFEVQFVSAERPFQGFINGLVTSKQQFFVPSSISIVSDFAEKAPSKSESESAAAAPPTPPPSDPSAPASPTPPTPPPTNPNKPRNIVVGDEKLKITMKVDIVDFVAPPAAKESPTEK